MYTNISSSLQWVTIRLEQQRRCYHLVVEYFIHWQNSIGCLSFRLMYLWLSSNEAFDDFLNDLYEISWTRNTIFYSFSKELMKNLYGFNTQQKPFCMNFITLRRVKWNIFYMKLCYNIITNWFKNDNLGLLWKSTAMLQEWRQWTVEDNNIVTLYHHL